MLGESIKMSRNFCFGASKKCWGCNDCSGNLFGGRKTVADALRILQTTSRFHTGGKQRTVVVGLISLADVLEQAGK